MYTFRTVLYTAFSIYFLKVKSQKWNKQVKGTDGHFQDFCQFTVSSWSLAGNNYTPPCRNLRKYLIKVHYVRRMFLSVTIEVIIPMVTAKKLFLTSAPNPFCWLNFKPVSSGLVFSGRKNSCFLLYPWASRNKTGCQPLSPALSVPSDPG